MPTPHLSPRRRALIAQQARYRSYSAVAEQFGIAKSTVGYCVMLSRLQALIPPAMAVLNPSHRRNGSRFTPRLDSATLATIYDVFEANPFASNRHVLDILFNRGVRISLMTLRRARRRLGYRRYVALVKPYLKPCHKEQRLAYAAEMKRLFMEWRMVIFCDEVPLYVDQLYKAYVTRPVGSDRTDERYVASPEHS